MRENPVRSLLIERSLGGLARGMVLVVALTGCNASPNFGLGGANLTPANATYTQVMSQILGPQCLNCHSDQDPRGGVSFSSYAATMASAGNVVPYQPYQSELFKQTQDGRMPRQAAMLTSAQLLLIYDWIAYGAPNN